jgi:hypothetical protein
MWNILSAEPHLTFEEVVKYYGRDFFTTDMDLLRNVYEENMEIVREEYEDYEEECGDNAGELVYEDEK